MFSRSETKKCAKECLPLAEVRCAAKSVIIFPNGKNRFNMQTKEPEAKSLISTNYGTGVHFLW